MHVASYALRLGSGPTRAGHAVAQFACRWQSQRCAPLPGTFRAAPYSGRKEGRARTGCATRPGLWQPGRRGAAHGGRGGCASGRAGVERPRSLAGAQRCAAGARVYAWLRFRGEARARSDTLRQLGEVRARALVALRLVDCFCTRPKLPELSKHYAWWVSLAPEPPDCVSYCATCAGW